MSERDGISVSPEPLTPLTPREVFHWLESGRLAPDMALKHLQQLEGRVFERAPGSAKSEADRVESIMQELDSLVGLAEIKRLVQEIRAFIEIQNRRRDLDLVSDPHMLHMIFKGAPGTGKTTVARILGKLFQALEVLPKGHLVEVERADLVGEYIGHTAQKTRDVIKQAIGGVMFVDEAYALARGGEKDFGKEAIDTLVSAMENHRDQFLLILAGYPEEMTWFMASNPGLLSRFPMHLDFPDYHPKELMAIGRLMLAEREYRLTPEAETNLEQYLADREGFWHPNAGNARMVRNLMERAIRRQAVRLMPRKNHLTRDDLMTLTWSDVEGGL